MVYWQPVYLANLSSDASQQSIGETPVLARANPLMDDFLMSYDDDRIGDLKRLLGTDKVEVKSGIVVIGEKSYPVVDDVISSFSEETQYAFGPNGRKLTR